MKKRINKILFLITGILLFVVSYSFDASLDVLFKNIKFPILDTILSVITNFGLVIVVTALIPSVILYKKNRRLVYLIWFTFIVIFVLAFVIKLTVLRQRPIGAFTYPFTNITDYSFPSMHAMAVFSLLPILMKYLPKQKYFFVIFAFLVAFTRIHFGFHFLSDVVFGAFAGYAAGDFILESYEKSYKQF